MQTRTIMIKHHTYILLIVGLILISLQFGLVHSEEVTQLTCEETVKHKEQALIEQKNELTQLNNELQEERELRKELQEQLDALTELEENINERETLDSNIH